MKFHRSPSATTNPKISVVLPCWSVRRSLPVLPYLRAQSLSRSDFEILLVEFHERDLTRSLASGSYDVCVSLGQPWSRTYHKGVLYNAGLALARGEVVVFCTPDVLMRPTFLASILERIGSSSPGAILFSRFCNTRRDLYPYRDLPLETILERCCTANPAGVTASNQRQAARVARDFRTCLAARRKDLLVIGGAEEAADYRGYIGGVYEMAIRLRNAGIALRWHPSEHLYHPWHPGHGGEGDYRAPHLPGVDVAPAGIIAAVTGRIQPWVPSPLLASLPRGGGPCAPEALSAAAKNAVTGRWVLDAYAGVQPGEFHPNLGRHSRWSYRGYVLYRSDGELAAVPAVLPQLEGDPQAIEHHVLRAPDRAALMRAIDRASGASSVLRERAGSVYFQTGRLALHVAAIAEHASHWFDSWLQSGTNAYRRIMTRAEARIQRSQRLRRWMERRIPGFHRLAKLHPARVAAAIGRVHARTEARARSRLEEIALAQEIASRLAALEDAHAFGWIGARKPLVVASQRVRACLRFLQALGLAPRPFEVYAVPAEASLEERLLEICRETDGDEVFVESTMLSRYPGFLGHHELPKKVIFV